MQIKMSTTDRLWTQTPILTSHRVRADWRGFRWRSMGDNRTCDEVRRRWDPFARPAADSPPGSLSGPTPTYFPTPTPRLHQPPRALSHRTGHTKRRAGVSRFSQRGMAGHRAICKNGGGCSLGLSKLNRGVGRWDRVGSYIGRSGCAAGLAAERLLGTVRAWIGDRQQRGILGFSGRGVGRCRDCGAVASR